MSQLFLDLGFRLQLFGVDHLCLDEVPVGLAEFLVIFGADELSDVVDEVDPLKVVCLLLRVDHIIVCGGHDGNQQVEHHDLHQEGRS